MAVDETWFPPSNANPLPVVLRDRSAPNVKNWFPPSSLDPLPVTIAGGGGSVMPEPPDNQLYGRRGPAGSGQWTLIAAAAGPPEAPAGGAIYGRGQISGAQAWTPVLPLAGGTMTGALILAADPIGAQQAATKQYVDNVGVVASGAVRKTGDAMTGFLTLVGDPGAPFQAATKNYVDAIGTAATNAVRRAGDTMTGPLILSGNPAVPLGAVPKQYADLISGVANGALQRSGGVMTGALSLAADPVLPLQAATKQYADAAAAVAGNAVRRSGDTMTGFLTLNADPVGAFNAVTKRYADAIMAVAQDGVDIHGDTMLGPLVLSGDPVTPLAAATRQYVDALRNFGIASYLPLAGGTISGSLTAGVPTPPLGGMQPGDINAIRVMQNGVVVAGGTITLAGDVIGAGAGAVATTVMRLRGRDIAPTLPLDTQVLAWNAAASQWAPAVRAAGGPPGGVPGAVQINAGGGAFDGITMTGDAVWNTATTALTLNTVMDTPGTFQGLTINAKGQVTAASNQNYVTGGALAGYLPLTGGTISGTAPGTLTINRNTFLPAIPAAAILPLWIVNADTDANPIFGMDAFGTSQAMLLRRANGTAAAPSRLINGDTIGILAFRGFGDTAYGPSSARIIAEALEDFHDTTFGSQIVFETTPSGVLTRNVQMRIGPGLTVGVPTPPIGGMQIGDINGSRILLNGVPLMPGSGGGGGGSVTLFGDVSGAGAGSVPSTVVGWQGRSVASTAPLDGQVMVWSSTANQWQPATIAGGVSTAAVWDGGASIWDGGASVWDGPPPLPASMGVSE